MKKLLSIILLSTIIYGCGNNQNEVVIEHAEPTKDTIIDTFEERVAEIDRLSDLVFSEKSGNLTQAPELVAAYADFLKFHDLEIESIEYTFKAGEVSKAINRPHDAIRYFNLILDRYPEYEKAPMALFYKAMVMGDLLHEDEQAKATYQEFIDKYPDHSLTESAKASINQLGKSLEEIVAGFEKQNEGK